jgi:BRCA1-associated RING domain protein 1
MYIIGAVLAGLMLFDLALLGVADCSSEMTRRPEASYVLSMDSIRTIDGPKKGRIRATKGVSYLSLAVIQQRSYIPGRNLTAAIRFLTCCLQTPKLFSGLRLCLSAYMDPDGRHRVRNLIATAGGQVLRGGFLDLLLGDSGGSSVGPYFVFDGDATGGFSRSTLRKEEVEARKHAALRARVISHLRVLDAVAAYDAEILDR